MKITMILATLLVACGASASVADRSPSFTATIAAPRSASPTVEPTKPPFAQPPLDPPSAIIWTEGGLSYLLTSRVRSIPQLVDLASALR